MEMPIGFVNGTNPCYVYYMRLSDCFNRESFRNLLCKDQLDDYKECKYARRHVIYFILNREKF